MILYRIVSPTREKLRDEGPFVSILSVSFNDGHIFLLSPSLFANFRIQMIMPALSALLSDATWQLFRYEAPVFGAMTLN
jgi:hypothetical protein